MDNNVRTLSQELKALNDEDLNQISGSGDQNYVRITDDQCKKINIWYDKHCADTGVGLRVVTNYGGICPRTVFLEALQLDDKPPM